MKLSLALILLILIPAQLFSQDLTMSDYSFYVPSDEEVAIFFSMSNYLAEMQSGKRVMDENTFFKICDGYIGKDSLQSLLFEMYLRQLKSEPLQAMVEKYFLYKKIDTPFSQSLLKIYSSNPVEYSQDGKVLIQYSYNDEEFDENINLFRLKEISLYDERLNIMTFNLDWSLFNISGGPVKKIDSLFFIFGGGTNSLTLHVNKYEKVSIDQVYNIISNKKLESKYENYQIAEVPMEGIIKRAGTDLYIVETGAGPDIVDGIVAGIFNGYLYSEESQTLFEVSYYMNFSENNISYSYRNRIFNYLLFMTLLCYLE